jgi:23S rRNA (uracil1939-C5)-methyltransferase
VSARIRPASPEAPAGPIVELAITALGSRGDGIGDWRGRPVFVPLALPGERLRVRLVGRRGEGFAGEPLAWLEQGERAPHRCPHFSRCGGCALQHLPDPAYLEWVRAQVADALARRRLPASLVEPAQAVPPASRRRARFSYARRGGGIELGFRARAAHTVVDLAGCGVLLPEIVALLPALRGLLAELPMAGRAGEVTVTATSGGLDALLIAAVEPGLEDREALAAFATAQDLARISWAPRSGALPEPIVQRHLPRIDFESVGVVPPPGAFLQASVPAEAAIRAAVFEGLGDAHTVADLFSGCGTFALPLAAAGRRVRAVDGDASMLAALTDASRAAGLGERIVTEVRDLERAPLAGPELAGLDAVILDPPRAGARAQCELLAESPVPRIAMVSCHPPSLARDLHILVDGGYRLLRVRPIDAFTWSGRIEAVAALARP